MVKGQNEKIKNKSFYIWMLSGALMLVCICAFYLKTGGLNGEPDKSNINKPMTEETQETKQPKKEVADIGNNPAPKITQGNLNPFENDVFEEGDQVKKDTATVKPETSKEPESKSVMANGKSILDSLKFDEEAGLGWPVSGNVILPFSESKPVYFATLGQYKRNNGIVISAEEGTKVVSAAKGVITKIFNNEETGLTVEMSIGGDYSLTYGQLKDLSVKKGDVVKEGQTIGVIAKPSKYYVVEGSNLYFKVTEEDKAVNPMYLFKN